MEQARGMHNLHLEPICVEVKLNGTLRKTILKSWYSKLSFLSVIFEKAAYFEFKDYSFLSCEENKASEPKCVSCSLANISTIQMMRSF